MGKLIKYITDNGGAVIVIADTTDVVSKAEQIHQTSAVVTAGLGRLLTAASMMGSALKNEKNSLTLRVSGDGPVGSLVAVSDWNGNVRGYAVNSVVEIPLNSKGKLDVGGAVGKGSLTVLKDLGEKEPYVGSIGLVSGEIAEDITAYYAYSEQIPTVCALGVLVNEDLTVNKAGGFLIQLLPGADLKDIEQIEENLNGLPSVTQMMTKGMTANDICDAVMKGFQLHKLEENKVSYFCPCSRERSEEILRSIGVEELTDMAQKDHGAELCCHFCDQRYHFTEKELLSFASEISKKQKKSKNNS